MTPSEQRAIAETYRDAASEHLTAAQDLYDLGRYVLACYAGGLAVECMLRAYRMVSDPVFDSRHDLDRLFKLAKFAELATTAHSDEIGHWLTTVARVWSNDLRFLSLGALRKTWAKRGLYDGVKGDFVKELTRQMLNAAERIVNLGAARWTTLFKN